MYEADVRNPEQAENDTARKTTFHIAYQNKKINRIEIERNFSSFEKKNQTIDIVYKGNKTFLFSEKDTLFIFELNKIGKPQKIISLHTRPKQKSTFEYDTQNRLVKEIRKGVVPDDLTIRFFYENKGEIKKIIKGDEAFGEFSKPHKYVYILDDKKNPFYQQYELAYLISDESAFFPNNITSDYHLSDYLSVFKQITQYTTHSRDFPLEANEYIYYFYTDKQYFQKRILFEYDCEK